MHNNQAKRRHHHSKHLNPPPPAPRHGQNRVLAPAPEAHRSGPANLRTQTHLRPSILPSRAPADEYAVYLVWLTRVSAVLWEVD
ncbi:hypothetical protein OPT61_g6731 [Boeremia exigua]|uniref:Uncharacterized protein n=1 Tax=Boeremia exigua TaxID=749465 RepID=A0ACC2I5X0_9PLEO|nr:hypothetical protein OPT61_g6731 [Boeremia exigua]